jgi:hypothetical protein
MRNCLYEKRRSFSRQAAGSGNEPALTSHPRNWQQLVRVAADAFAAGQDVLPPGAISTMRGILISSSFGALALFRLRHALGARVVLFTGFVQQVLDRVARGVRAADIITNSNIASFSLNRLAPANPERKAPIPTSTELRSILRRSRTS